MKKRLFVTDPSRFVGQPVRSRLTSSDSSWDLLPVASTCELIHPHSRTNLRPPLPDAIIQLAGQTLASEAFRDPARTLQINLLATFTLLQHPRMRGCAGTFLPAGSADVFAQNGAYLTKSTSTFIAAEHKLRQESSRVIDLPIVKTPSGEYRGVDNIVRFENQYSRTV
ncbi:NAD-dependent epimerase/dehydratase family protein [Pseudomonas protegens]